MKQPILRKILIILCVLVITLGSITLGLYSFGYIGFEDGKLHFYFNNEEIPEDPEEPEEPTITIYTIHLQFPDDTVVDYEYDTINGTFSPTAQNTWVEDQTTEYRFDNWYTNESFTTLFSLINLRDGTTLYAKMIEQIEIRIYAPTSSSAITDYESYKVDQYSMFYVDDKISFTGSCISGVYSDSAYTTETNSTFSVVSAKNIYLRWASPQSNFTFTSVTGGYEISSYTGAGGTVLVPAKYRNNVGTYYNVVSINSTTFYEKTTITEVVLPSSIKTIGASAFWGCTHLTSITIPSSVTSIGEGAFNGCTSFTNVTIPSGVTSIGEGAFSNCTSLTNVTIPSSVTSMGVYSFGNCTSLASIIIPGSVTSIGMSAFEECTSLTSVTIQNGVTSIGEGAFSYCTHLTSLTIPGSVTSIGDNAFSDCTSLTSITIPSSVTGIGNYAFSSCTSLVSIIVDSNSINYSSADGVLFNKDKSTLICYPAGKTAASYEIPSSVISIGMSAFSYCTYLARVTIPSSVTNIGGEAFRNCTHLTSITIPSSVISIGNYAFYNCTSLTGITVEATTPPTLSGTSVFDNTNNCPIYVPVARVNTYKSASYWSEYTSRIYPIPTAQSMFTWSTSGTNATITGLSSAGASLTSIVIPKTYTNGTITYTVTTIGDYAFFYKTTLNTVYILPGITSIGEDAFNGCTALTGITIPNSVTSIGKSAFQNCTSLTSITIPSSVTSIEIWAFVGCTSLTTITVDSANTSYSSNNGVLFNKNKTTLICYPAAGASTTYTIPSSVTSIVSNAFFYCIGLTSVTIPNSVTSIGTQAFQNCTSLTSVIMQATTPPTLSGTLSYVFNYTNDCPIYVPAASVNAYKAAAGWSGYSSRIYAITDQSMFTWTTSGTSAKVTGLSSAGASLTSIIIPNTYTNGITTYTVKSVGGQAFKNNTALSKVTIPSGVTSIEYQAFFGCISLTNVTIPSSVTNIGNAAFYNCISLASITVEATTPPVLGNVYECFDNTNNCPIYVPAARVNTYKTATGWSRYASRIQAIIEG